MMNSDDRKLVGQSVYEQLRSDIVTGTLSPGEKLKLNALRIRYSASVNTLRETLMRLVSDGFVLFVDQKGFSVKPVSTSDLHELLELRQMLELSAVRKSMANKDGQIEWKSALISAHFRLNCVEKMMMEDEVSHVQAWEKADRDFHMTMVSHCGSQQLIRYHASVIELYMRYQVLALHRRPFRGQASVEEHQELLKHLLADDLESVLAILDSHIQKGLSLPDSETAVLAMESKVIA
ncbi:GntR family transcriptional regulator [Marinomonas sp. CT5]|uniref:GntR family transcriptional regulator n=1 Tax=Marinomonas sp. CT5 TaxID=2066133 RepID=UPI001796100F|nr:GntR family transcriptional regulator [Marinomonas sp. CT5]NVK73293.1 GntR family transcriptional regulator [Oceanospirillaceae bacterium]QUX97361.1 GntR family transcriptional regulator [Marinomonas sp. CT5]